MTKKHSSKLALIGTIKTLSNGSAVVSIENTFMENVFIPKKDLNGAFNQDQVEIQINYNFNGIRIFLRLCLGFVISFFADSCLNQ